MIAINFLNKLNICHRDINPNNIYLDINLEEYSVKLTDFGNTLFSTA